jgi:putative membrane protein
MVSARLSDSDHRLVSDAVAAAERGTDGEIVTIVTDRSDAYHDVGLHYAVAAMLLVPAGLALFPHWLSTLVDRVTGGWGSDPRLASILLALFAAMTIVFLIVRYTMAWMPLRMALTPRATKARRVRRRAIAFFKVAAERRTVGRTGVLIYLSMAEHDAEIVVDEAIHKRVPPEIWGDAMAALVDEVRAGRIAAGMAAAVAQVGVILKEHFPHLDDTPNELPDRLIEL